jgi:hypothetical protein
MRRYKALDVAVHAAPDKQMSLTDPDARSMAMDLFTRWEGPVRRHAHRSDVETARMPETRSAEQAPSLEVNGRASKVLAHAQ